MCNNRKYKGALIIQTYNKDKDDKILYLIKSENKRFQTKLRCQTSKMMLLKLVIIELKV